MKILILGGDGYLGWPTAMHLSDVGHEVMIVDNFVKRQMEMESGVEPLHVCPALNRRCALWKDVTGKEIHLRVGDLLNQRFIYNVLEDFTPDTIVHYAEQPSAPYSMIGREQAVKTMLKRFCRSRIFSAFFPSKSKSTTICIHHQGMTSTRSLFFKKRFNLFED